jgi:dipeptidyl aminopeptidase/acylaminoacyl peptidase
MRPWPTVTAFLLAAALRAAPALPAAPTVPAAPTAPAAPAVPAAPAEAAAGRPLTPEDFYRLQIVSDPQVSPDGAWVAYVVTSFDREADEARSAIWMVSWDGTSQVALTHAANGIRAPRWSPDGRTLAFVSTPAGADKEQISTLDRRGGEAQVLTALTQDLGNYAWAPDGRRLVLVARAGAEAVGTTAKGGAVSKPQPVVIDAVHFKQDEDGYLGRGSARHLFLFDRESRQLEPLAHAAGASDDQPVWSPDGARIAFVRSHDAATLDGRIDVDVVAARAGAQPVTLARPYGPNETTNGLLWSPDGRLLAYLEGREPRYNAYMQDRLRVIPADGGAPRELTDRLDRAVKAWAFSADSAALWAIVEDDGSSYPARIDAASGALTRLLERPSTATALAAAGGHTALLWSDDTAASEVYAYEDGRLRRLTHHNDAFLAGIRLGAVSDVAFASRDGTAVHGLLVTPPDYVAGRSYPAVLWVHGGPNGQDAHSLDFEDYQFRRQLLAAGGLVVLGVNYRGSSGRGGRFASTILADWGDKEVLDLLAGADHLVARGIADPARLGIGGWSYGGILTDYAIAADRRFKAAVSGAGSANQLAMYGSDQYILSYSAELGPPWRNPALWMKLSYPFFHADRIRTPTLFLGGDEDFNVPIAGSEQMYQALRTLGVPTQLVVYPGQAHELKRPSFLVDRAQRIGAWYAQYLAAVPAGRGGAPPAPGL